MNSKFHVINDKKYDFIDVELRKLVMKAGRKKIIFLEGYDDKIIFEIVYKDFLGSLHFIDTSMKATKTVSNSYKKITGGCETVKKLLKKFIKHLPNEKRFYGVIDRDLDLDDDIESKKCLPCYGGRLFIFFERYTLENYFIEIDVLCDFLHNKSVNVKNLIPLLSDSTEFRKNITKISDEILDCLTKIGAANLTIRSFDDEIKFLEDTISCDEIEKRLLDNSLSDFTKMNDVAKNDVIKQFNCFETFIRENNATHKFANAKKYFSYQFNKHLKKQNVDIQLNNHKSELAIILKDYLPNDFKHFLQFINEKIT